MARAKKRQGDVVPGGSIPLAFGAEQYAPIAMTGVLGAMPVTAWLASIGMALHIDDYRASGAAASPEIGALMVVMALVLMLVVPWLVPCLVLRARQPRGARIEWDDEQIVEWDGPWRRTVIPWNEVEVAHVAWAVSKRTSTLDSQALQLFARGGDATITAWDATPPGAPTIRRRLHATRIGELRKAIESRGIAMTRAPDWSLARDPDRTTRPLERILGRFGYPCAVLAPLAVSSARPAWIVVAIAGAALLALRAAPAFREVRAITARLREGHAPAESDGPADDASPYRAASARAPAAPDEGRTLADRLKLRAAVAEALVRGACVVLVVVSTALSFAS